MPRATDHIQDQIDMVKVLEEKWYTYEIPDDWIYMDTSKVSDYGKLANLQNQNLKTTTFYYLVKIKISLKKRPICNTWFMSTSCIFYRQ